jgi:hypothetical protein
MQFTATFVAIVLAATGVMAEAEADRGYNRPSRVNNNWNSNNGNGNQINNQEIKCGSNSGAYCCSPGYDSKGGLNYYDCKSFVGSCNAITICCNNNAQGKVSKRSAHKVSLLTQ